MSMQKFAEIVTQALSGQKWRTYEKYRDSGVEWVGMVPKHWVNWKITHAFKLIGSGTTPPSSNPEYYDGDIPWVNTSELKDGFILNTQKKITPKALADISVFRVYPSNTLLIALYGATIGKVGILCIPATINQACCALSFPDKLNIRFTFYWFIAHRQLLISLAEGGGQPNINQEIIRSLRIPAPSQTEQHAIAAFLDHQTARIDALITKKEQHIALLQEKRAALISQAVTQGLHPDVPMKDSGVEWLGMVPEHWKVRRLKFVAKVMPGLAKGRNLGERDTVELPYLRVANVQDGYLDLSDIAMTVVGIDEIARYSLETGDILMNEGGDFDKLGRGYVWSGEISPCLHQNHVFAVRTNLGIDPYWINLIALTSYAKYYFIIKSKQSTNLASISSTNLKELPLVFPPDEEQKAIMVYLNQQTQKIDALISTITDGIKKLQEYRTALISAAVTGKIDVRGMAAEEVGAVEGAAN